MLGEFVTLEIGKTENMSEENVTPGSISYGN